MENHWGRSLLKKWCAGVTELLKKYAHTVGICYVSLWSHMITPVQWSNSEAYGWDHPIHVITIIWEPIQYKTVSIIHEIYWIFLTWFKPLKWGLFSTDASIQYNIMYLPIQRPLLLAWFNFHPIMDNWLHPLYKSDVKCRNNLSCLDQYTCRGLRLWNSQDREAV